MNNDNNPKKNFIEETLKPKTEISSQSNATEDKKEVENKTPSDKGILNKIDELLGENGGVMYSVADDNQPREGVIHEARGENPVNRVLRNVYQRRIGGEEGNETPGNGNFRNEINGLLGENGGVMYRAAEGNQPREGVIHEARGENPVNRVLRNVYQRRIGGEENETPGNGNFRDEINELIRRNNDVMYRAAEGNQPREGVIHEARGENPANRVLRNVYQRRIGGEENETPGNGNFRNEINGLLGENDGMMYRAADGNQPRGGVIHEARGENPVNRVLRDVYQRRIGGEENETPGNGDFRNEMNEVLERVNAQARRAVAEDPLMQEAQVEYPIERVLRDYLHQPGVNEGEGKAKTPSSDNQIINNEPDDSYEENLEEDEKEVSEDEKEEEKKEREEEIKKENDIKIRRLLERVRKAQERRRKKDGVNIGPRSIEEVEKERKEIREERRKREKAEEDLKEKEEDLKEKEEDLRKREEDLRKKEEDLKKKEEDLKNKEEDLKKKKEDLKEKKEINADADSNDSSSVIYNSDYLHNVGEDSGDESENE